MFGRMFQPQGLPSSYRRVAWLQSDGVAYINLDYAPLDRWRLDNYGTIEGTRILLRAKYPATSTIAPGVIFGSSDSLRFQPTRSYNGYIPDSGTIASWTGSKDSYTNIQWARDCYGKYSGTAKTIEWYYGVEETVSINADGSISRSEWDDSISQEVAWTDYPTYPAQASSSNPFYERFALAMIVHASGYDYTFSEAYTATKSQSFFANAMTSLFAEGEANIPSTSKVGFKVTVETSSGYIGEQNGWTTMTPVRSMYLFANNNENVPTSFDRNVKVDSLTITEGKAGHYVSDPAVITTKRNLVACVRKRDEKPGMYDLKNHRFFTNAADTGEFLFAELTD